MNKRPTPLSVLRAAGLGRCLGIAAAYVAIFALGYGAAIELGLAW